MAGAGFSGKDGDVKIGSASVAEIRTWSFNPKSNNPSYASHATGGYKRRVAGVKDGSGSTSGAIAAASLPFSDLNVGSDATLVLYLNATLNFSVPSVVDDLRVNVDIDNGEIVSWDMNFSTNGGWTNPGGSLRLDPAAFDPVPEGALGVGAESPGGASGREPPPPPVLSAEVIAAIAAAAARACLEAIAAGTAPPPAAAEPPPAAEPAAPAA